MGVVKNYGKVVIAGAGPGDPELITYKAIKALRAASVILTDRLVSPGILNRFVSSASEIIYVGKEAYKRGSSLQSDINRLMVQHAKEGKMVVRLKGGDVSIFSNVLSELEALREHDINYEIIPGITAASGAAAYGGIPLTARGYSSAVRYLCYYKHENFSSSYWKELAATDDTLVFYMTGENLQDLVEKLVKLKIDRNKMLAIIEQATTPLQNVFTSSLYEYTSKIKRKPISPSIVVIGKVVALNKAFGWIKNSNSTASFFPSNETASEIFEDAGEVLTA